MKFKLHNSSTACKSLSIYLKNKEVTIRYWGGFKFDYFVIHSGN